MMSRELNPNEMRGYVDQIYVIVNSFQPGMLVLDDRVANMSPVSGQ